MPFQSTYLSSDNPHYRLAITGWRTILNLALRDAHAMVHNNPAEVTKPPLRLEKKEAYAKLNVLRTSIPGGMVRLRVLGRGAE